MLLLVTLEEMLSVRFYISKLQASKEGEPWLSAP